MNILLENTISIFKVRDFGLGNMVFLWAHWCMGLRLGFFYVGLGVGLLVVPS